MPELAKAIEWQPEWSAGAPLPQVFTNGHKIYLIYLIDTPDPAWDGTYTTMVSASEESEYPLALVEFCGNTFRFGIANDEVFSGLPLWGKNLDGYGAYLVENSRWIDELKTINKVHPNYNEGNWGGMKHHMFLFHDEILEVIAHDFKIERFTTTFKKLAIEVIERMYSA